MSIKLLHHVCIQTEDYQESLKFYTNILGFELVAETANFHGRDYNTWLRCGKGDEYDKVTSRKRY
jgi:glyoxylase I family protein